MLLEFADKEGLKASQTNSTEKVRQTRKSTLDDFNIDLDIMTNQCPDHNADIVSAESSDDISESVNDSDAPGEDGEIRDSTANPTESITGTDIDAAYRLYDDKRGVYIDIRSLGTPTVNEITE